MARGTIFLRHPILAVILEIEEARRYNIEYMRGGVHQHGDGLQDGGNFCSASDEAALRRTVDWGCLEDNTQCVAAVNNGYSAVLRSLSRTERIVLSVAHEVFIETAENALIYEETSIYRGNMFTKRLAAPALKDAVARIGMKKIV